MCIRDSGGTDRVCRAEEIWLGDAARARKRFGQEDGAAAHENDVDIFAGNLHHVDAFLDQFAEDVYKRQDAERAQIIAFAVERAAGRVPVIAGTGSNDTAKAVALARSAEAEGADALLVVTPYYNKAGDDGLIQHFTAIAERVQVPIIAYNVPSRTGVNLKPEIVVELAKHPRIRGIKEASGNMRQIAELCRLAGDGLYQMCIRDRSTIWCVPRARLWRMVLAMRSSMGLSITVTGTLSRWK